MHFQDFKRTIFLLFLVLNTSSLINGLISNQRVVNGTLIISGLFELQSVGNSGECGEVQTASVMTMEAVRWYLNSFNRENSLPYQIGFSVYKTCGNLGHAGDAAVDIVGGYRSTDSPDELIVGVIGPEYSSETQVVSSILGSQSMSDRMLQIGFSATSTKLNDRSKYSNYYRVVADDEVQTSTMLQLMLDLKWNRIAVVYVNDTYGRSGAKMLEDDAENFHICISKIDAIEIDSSRHVEASQIRQVLSSYVIKAPSIEGVVYFGTMSIANQVMQIFDDLQMSDVPILLLSESNLDVDVFKSISGNVLPKTKGSLALSLPYIEDNDFKLYWESLFKNKTVLQEASIDNPYLKDVFTTYKGCELYTPNCDALTETEIQEVATQSVYVHYALLAVHTMTEVLSKFFENQCSVGCNTIQDLQQVFTPYQLIEAMDGLSVTYKSIKGSFTANSPNIAITNEGKEYEVYNFRKELGGGGDFTFVDVGYRSKGALVLQTDKIKDYAADGTERDFPDVRLGQCPVGNKCTECIDDNISEINYHIPGDFYVVGIVSINNKAIPGPLGCGTVRTRHGYQMYLSLEFALEEFHKRSWYTHYKNMFGGKSIGLVVINSCNNALEVVPKILELHSKGLKLPDGTHLDLKNRILGYIGGQAADTSEPAAAQLTKLGIVQISYTSTNPVLSNKELYPYFLRIISPDNLQAQAMIDIVKELGGEYIQVVYSEGAYGEGGRDVVLAVAKVAKICVAQTIMVTEKDTYYEYYNIIRRKPHAKIIIVFLRSHVVAPFLKHLNSEMTRGQYQFIGSEAWGKNTDALGYDITRGALITAVEMDKNRDLEEFIKDKIPIYNITNHWLEEYIQNRQDCYYSWSYDKTFSNECEKDLMPVDDPNFVSDPWCIFVANTMFAFLKGAAIFYSNQCGLSASGELCPNFVDSPEKFFNVLKAVQVDIYGSGDMLVFDEKGDGLMGYKIYNVQDGKVDKTVRDYSGVGSYNPSSGLQLNTEAIVYPTDDAIRSTCPSESACADCIADDTADTQSPDEKQSAAVPVLGALVGILSVSVIILAVVLILKIRRKPPDDTYIEPTYLEKRPTTEGEQRESDNDYVSENSAYITPNET